MSKLYVGNLSYGTTEESLRAAFADFEPVQVSIVMDRETGRSKGFGFVTCSSDEMAEKAIATSIELDGRTLKVDAARPPSQSSGGFGGGRSSGGRRPSSGGSRSHGNSGRSGGYSGGRY
jgi:RNA recognition motif-containing protein